jgi:hypothetical protein
MAMNEHQRLADSASRMLRYAELNEHWAFMEHLLGTLREMGGKVIRVADPNYKWRADYMVQFRLDSPPDPA